MLFITRREGEKVGMEGMNGGEIQVQILKIEGDSVRIGIQAATGVSIHRYEVYAKITDANQSAMTSKPPQAAILNLLRQRKPEPGNSDA